MPKAKEAQEWAKEEFKGIMDDLYTPWTKDDNIDESALRKAVRRILADLKSEGLWYNSTVGEGYYMTMAEKKQAAEIVVDEARKANPKSILILCVTAEMTCAKDTIELINHSTKLGIDMVAIQTPTFLYGEEGIMSWFGCIAENTDIALSFFQRAPWILSPQLVVKIAEKWPAYCAIKNTVKNHGHSAAIHQLARGKIQVHHVDLSAYLCGMLKSGELAPVIHCKSTWRYQTPQDLRFRDFWYTLVNGDLREAGKKYYDYYIFQLGEFFDRYSQEGHGFSITMHNAALEKFWAARLGMPMGSGGWQKCRPGCADVPKELQDKLVSLLTEAGLIKD